MPPLLFPPEPEIRFNKTNEVPVQLPAFLPGHLDQAFQEPVIDQFCEQEEFAERDIQILQIEGIEGLDGDIIQEPPQNALSIRLASSPARKR